MRAGSYVEATKNYVEATKNEAIAGIGWARYSPPGKGGHYPLGAGRRRRRVLRLSEREKNEGMHHGADCDGLRHLG
jgi:hypothetical protein